VQVLEECWQATVTGRRDRFLLLDLTGVTSIDAAGEACLAAMHRQGAAFIAADPLTKGIVAEITQAPLPDCGRPKGEGESRP
jgi:hypothetical protein